MTALCTSSLKPYLERRDGNGSDVLASRRFGFSPEGFLSGGFQEIVPLIGEASPYEVRHRFMKGSFNQSLILGKQRVFIGLFRAVTGNFNRMSVYAGWLFFQFQ